MTATLKQALDQIERRHNQYIESVYHIRNDRLIRDRKRLLDRRHAEGGVASEPWLEATPSYRVGAAFDQLGLPERVSRILTTFATQGYGAFNPPFTHQAEALQEFFVRNKDLVVSTGTGSGKTEIFLYSILGQLVQEGARSGGRAPGRAMRAIILYPMNALVSDQLARLRKFFGGEPAARTLAQAFGRTAQFGMYTSRAPYHGVYDPKKNEASVKPVMKYFKQLVEGGGALYDALASRGRIPAKDIVPFFGERKAADTRYRTQPGDRELFTRQEMHSPNQHGGTPDILVTNYSMLQYMLLRPIEQPLFNDTREWLKDRTNQITLVVDEAHLYRGAQGAEVSMLLRRLMQHLDIGRDQVRFILTSASLGSGSSAEIKQSGAKFAADLTASTETSRFAVVLGERKKLGGAPPLTAAFGRALLGITPEMDVASLLPLASYYGWPPLPSDRPGLQQALHGYLGRTPEFKAAHDWFSGPVRPLSQLARDFFPDMAFNEAQEAVLNLALVLTFARESEDKPLLPMRIHALYRGLPRQYACVNPRCSGRGDGTGPLGRLFLNPQMRCESCGSRVFEMYTHRTCGAAYLRAWYHPSERQGLRFLWAEGEKSELQEVHLLVDTARSDADPDHEAGVPLAIQYPEGFLDRLTGFYMDRAAPGIEDRLVRVRWPPAISPGRSGPSSPREPNSWKRCPACGIDESRARGQKIMDLETKGEEPFANLVRTLFSVQPEAQNIPPEMLPKLPNRGRKVLCFSDSRQKAARLARDLQRTVERDSFRETLVLAASIGGPCPVDHLFARMVGLTSRSNTGFFDDEDETQGVMESGSRARFTNAQKQVSTMLADYQLGSVEELIREQTARQELDGSRPAQYDEYLLRALGDPHYSIRATMVGYAEPTPETWESLKRLNPTMNSDALRGVILALIEYALERRAFDPRISDVSRRNSRRSPAMPQGWRLPAEGYGPEELVAPKVRRILRDLGLDAEAQRIFQATLRRSGLYAPGQNRWWLNPAAISLRVDVSDHWMICRGCGKLTLYSFGGRCPSEDCLGEVVRVSPDDLYVNTRKSFLRQPAIDAIRTQQTPLSMRSEEHTAQLTAKDRSEAFGKAEKYELLFQDVLVDDLEHQQPVDVLSCTTTMEVGIDIGSLTAVALRTVPPRPDNYQQRAGRAGRRASALSFILTFADNSPHETYVFRHPHTIIGAPNASPSIYIENAKIAERHVYAALIQAFFQARPAGPGNQNVFESLGTAREFFAGNSEFSFDAFRAWFGREIQPSSRTAKGISTFIPDELAGPSIESKVAWATAAGTRLVQSLQRVASKGGTWSNGEDEANLLSVLLDEALLPTFGFPIDVCTFAVRDYGRSKGSVVSKYEVQQDLAAALSEYIPGRELVVDKRTYVSYGLHFPYSPDSVNRARVVDWTQLEWLNHCRHCGAKFDERTRNLQEENFPCPACRNVVESVHRFKPLGFSPRFGREGPEEGGEPLWERVPATRAEFPLPVVPIPKPGVPVSAVSAVAEFQRLANQRLVVANFGLDYGGFHVCQDCGAVSTEAPLAGQHLRPYPVPLRPGVSFRQTCSGPSAHTAFAFEFNTDLAVFRVAMKAGVRFARDDPGFRASATSLAEAFVLGATRALGIEASELAGNFRTIGRYEGDSADTLGYVEFFLYDTTPGGAGFASNAVTASNDVLRETRRILADCTCGSSCIRCLRTYDNRFDHPILNRHLATNLLDYALSGMLSPISDMQARTLLNLVAAAVALRRPEVTIGSSGASRATFTAGSRTVEVQLVSTLAANRDNLLQAGPAQLLRITDHAVETQLPLVATAVSRGL